MFKLFKNLQETERDAAVQKIITSSSPHLDFFLQSILATLMATLGLLANNVAIIIGSMLIAPVLYPLLGIGMGIVMKDFKVIRNSLKSLVIAVILSVIASTLLTLFYVHNDFSLLTELQAREKVTTIEIAIAFIAGLAATFALVKPKISEALPGVAVSVSLIPPLAATGLYFAKQNWVSSGHTFLLFTTNVGGVIVASAIVFFIMNFAVKRNVAEKQVVKEEQAIANEKRQVIK